MIIFQEEATGLRVNVSESDYRDRMNGSRSVDFICEYDGEIELDTEAQYMDKDENIIISGKIKLAREISKDIDSDLRIYEIEIFDEGYILIEENINQIFRDKKPEEIIEEIVTDLGLTFVNETEESLYTIEKKTYRDKKPIAVINELCDTLGASWTVRDNNFYLYRRESTLSSITINENTEWIIKDGWAKDTDKKASTVIVRGSEILQRTTEVLSGTGTEFFTTRTPEDIEIDGLTQTTDQIEGDYEVDKQQKKITFETSQTDPEVKYSYFSQLRVQVGSGEPVRIIERKYIEEKPEARNLGRKYLELYQDGLLHSEWQTPNIFLNVRNIRVGDRINVINKINTDKNGEYIIEEIIREYPRKIEIRVGQDITNLFDWQKETKDRIEQLEVKEQNADFITRDIFKIGNFRVKVESNLTHLFGAKNIGELLFASEDPLVSGADMIYDDGFEPEEFALAVDDSELPNFPNSYVNYL